MGDEDQPLLEADRARRRDPLDRGLEPQHDRLLSADSRV
jgi:hypothetical protein